MNFLSAGFLFGLGAIAVPVILHLIQRQRYPERHFTTLRFFDLTVKHNVIQRRLVDRLLLLLRVLALTALALGLARPFWGGPFGQKRVSMVIVLDNSPSMARQRDGRSLFELARGSARRLLDKLGPADRVAVILSTPTESSDETSDRTALRRALERRSAQPTGLLAGGESGSRRSIPGMTRDTQALRLALEDLPEGTPVALCGAGLRAEPILSVNRDEARCVLDAASVSGRAGKMSDALAEGAKLLAASRDGDASLVVLSDLQAAEWRGGIVEGLAGRPVQVLRAAPNAADGPNLGIEGCLPAEPEAGLGETIAATATVRNYGTARSGEAVLEVRTALRSRPSEVRVPPIEPGESARVSFPIAAMGRERSLRCSLRLHSPDDPLPHDDAWYFQLGVRAPVSVLCVNGVPAASPAERASFFVMNALALPGAVGRVVGRVNVRERDLDDMEDEALFQYRVIVLAGVSRLGEAMRRDLGRFVTDGGGLLVFPGRQLDVEEGNGWGLLPARLVERKQDEFAYLGGLSRRAQDGGDIADRVGSGFQSLTTRNWLLLEPGPNSEVVARFGGGAPALVAGSLGAGRVILAATGCHTSGSDWPLRPAFPILLHALVSGLGTPAEELPLTPERRTGERLARRIPRELVAGTPAVFRLDEGDGTSRYMGLPWLRNAGALVLPAAGASGQYVLAVRPGSEPGLLAEPGVGADVTTLSVNHSPAESDLTLLGDAALPDHFPGARVETSVLDETTDLTGLYTGRELWRVLLVVALVILIAESLVGWRVPSQSTR